MADEVRLTEQERRALSFLAETVRGEAVTGQIARRSGLLPVNKARTLMLYLADRGLAKAVTSGWGGRVYSYRITDAGRTALAALQESDR